MFFAGKPLDFQSVIRNRIPTRRLVPSTKHAGQQGGAQAMNIPANIPVAHDLPTYNALLRQTCGSPFEASHDGHQGIFIGGLIRQDIDGLELSRIRTNAGRIVCRNGAKSPSTADDRYCFLVVQRQGHSLLRQHGGSVELQPGDIMLLDPVKGCEIVPHGLMEHASIRLDRSQVARMLPDQLANPGRIGRFSSSSRLMRVLVEQICAGGMDDCAMAGDGSALQDALLVLLAQSVRQQQGNTGVVQTADAAPAARAITNHSMLAMVQDLVEQSLTDPLLTPTRIAQRTGISVRQLYRLFEEKGDSVCRYIQRTRLQWAATELRSVLTQTRSITDIAFACGFNDAAHFSRAFRKEFGVSPRQYRFATELTA